MMTVARQFTTTTTMIHRVASLSEGGPRTAAFDLEGEPQALQFDGKFEDCVLSNVSFEKRAEVFKGIQDLQPLFQDGTFQRTREQLRQDEVVKVDLGTDRKWTASKTDDGLIEFRNGASRLFLEESTDRNFNLRVKADLANIEQEIGGNYNPLTGTITFTSEKVVVSAGDL